MSVAVAHYYPVIRPGGGPAGYLFNLRLGLVGHSSRELIDIVTSAESSQRSWSLANGAGGRATLPRNAKGSKGRRLLAGWRVASKWRYGRLPQKVRDRLASYPVVVFHDVRHALWYFRENGGPRAQQVFITLHSSVDAASEEVLRLSADYGNEHDWSRFRASLRQVECQVYKRAHGLIVPVRVGVDGYFDGAAKLQDQFLNLWFEEITVGVQRLTPRMPRDVARQQLGVAGRQVMVGYLWPHDTPNRFGVYLEVARQAEVRYPGRFAFVASETGGRQRNGPPGRGDVSWSADNFGDYVYASDVVMVPESYELVDQRILEAMTMAKVVITSATRGNRWLTGITQGIIVSDCWDVGTIVTALADLTKLGKLRLLGGENFDAYLARFTLDAFVRRHLEFAGQTLASTKSRTR